MELTFFDAQIRSVRRSIEDLRNLRYFGTTHVLTTAFDSQKFSVAAEVLDFWDGLIGAEVERLSLCDIAGSVAIGMLPSARPTRSHYEVFEGMEARLRPPQVRAVGEIGVWEPNHSEWELFRRQVQLAKDFELPVVITPPEVLRINLTYAMMKCLDEMDFPRHQTLFNHSCEITSKTLFEEGFGVGVVVGSFGMEPTLAARLVSTLVNDGGLSAIYVTSGMSDGPADVLGLPKLARELRELGLVEESIRQVMFENASRLFTRNPPRRVLSPDP